jgi:hypothetical protein
MSTTTTRIDEPTDKDMFLGDNELDEDAMEAVLTANDVEENEVEEERTPDELNDLELEDLMADLENSANSDDLDPDEVDASDDEIDVTPTQRRSRTAASPVNAQSAEDYFANGEFRDAAGKDKTKTQIARDLVAMGLTKSETAKIMTDNGFKATYQTVFSAVGKGDEKVNQPSTGQGRQASNGATNGGNRIAALEEQVATLTEQIKGIARLVKAQQAKLVELVGE